MGKTVSNLCMGRTQIRRGFNVVVGLILIVILVRFVATSLSELRDNWNSDRSDQGVFLQLGLNVKGKPIHFDRLDDPLYPFLQRSFGQRDGAVCTHRQVDAELLFWQPALELFQDSLHGRLLSL